MSLPKVAVAGCGHWGKNLVRNFNELGALAAVVDPTDDGRERARTIAPETRIEADLAAVLEDDAILGVVVATPAATHAQLVTAALEAGKDVLCEKPLALHYPDGVKLGKLARQGERILMTGHVLEYHPAIIRLHELVEAGELGRLQYVYSNRLNLGKIRREENILWSFAPHDIAVILRLFGSLPFQVLAAGGTFIQPNVADVTISHLLFDDGRAAHIFVSWLNPFKEQRLVVVGDQKMASFDDVNKELVVYDQRVDVSPDGPVPIKGDGTIVDYPRAEPLRAECEAFLEAIGSRQQPLTDAQSSLRVLRVLQGLQRSLMTQGRPILLPME